MDKLYEELFRAMNQFRKLHMGDLVPDITKLEGMTMAAIKHCSGEKEELTVSELTAKLKAKGPAVSRTLKTLEDKGYIERDVNKADRRNTYVKLTASGEQKQEEQVRQQNEAVAKNRPEAKNDENVSPQRQFWDKVKEKYPDALHLIRTGRD